MLGFGEQWLEPKAAANILVSDDGMEWEMLNEDPQIELCGVKKDRRRRHYTLELYGGPVWQHLLEPVLYYDTGQGFSETNSIKLVFAKAANEKNDGRIEAHFFLPRGVRALRFDPATCPGSIKLTGVRLLRSHDIKKRPFRRLLFQPGGLAVLSVLRQAGAAIRNDGWRGVKNTVRRELTSDFDDRKLPTCWDRYERWSQMRSVNEVLRAAFMDKAAGFNRKPKFSVIMPCYEAPLEYLELAVRSLMKQTYGLWELCLVEDGSSKASEVRKLLSALAAEDERACEMARQAGVFWATASLDAEQGFEHRRDTICGGRIRAIFCKENNGIAGASNTALDFATGEFVAFLDQDDELAPHALHAVADALQRRPDADWIYSDEDKIDTFGRRHSPFFKPDWSPTFLTTCMYTCHLSVYRRKIVEKVGRFRPAFEFAQDYDLAFRMAAATNRIVHIPDVLYHWRTLETSTALDASAKPIAEVRARAAVQAFVDQGKTTGLVKSAGLPGLHRVTHRVEGRPKISLAILSAGKKSIVDAKEGNTTGYFVSDFVKSIFEHTRYSDYEVVVASNEDFDLELLEQLDRQGVRVVEHKLSQGESFNLSTKMNFLVENCTGDYVVLLNDDMHIVPKVWLPGENTGTVEDQDWLAEMLGIAQQDDVVAVGAKLVYPDETLQHVGVILLGQGPSHPYLGFGRESIGYGGYCVLPHEVSAVTGACLMVRRSDFWAVDGFDPFFKINYNDIDFCARLRRKIGGRIVWTPYAQLYHFESVSREPAPDFELTAINERLDGLIGADPYYNKHLSQSSNNHAVGVDIETLEESYDLLLPAD